MLEEYKGRQVLERAAVLGNKKDNNNNNNNNNNKNLSSMSLEVSKDFGVFTYRFTQLE
jgi:hypothetical protein